MISATDNKGHSAIKSNAILSQSNAHFDTQTQEVLTTTLDIELRLLCDQNTRVDLLKIDVEGFEGFVMAGSRHILSKCPPKFIFIEIQKHLIDSHGFQVDTFEIMKLLKASKYELLMAENNVQAEKVGFWKSEKLIKEYVKNINSWGDYLFKFNI